MDGISVVICCYNSAERITETLSHLFKQTRLSINDWEIIIVDNSSTDNTNDVSVNFYNQYPGNKPQFKIVEEKEAGLSNARIKGIKAAKFDYIIFCDDDNWLSPDYLYNALLIMTSNKDIAVLGGMGEPEFETKEPPYFWENQFYLLATGPQSDKDFDDLTNTRKVVYGAGMVINKCAFNELISKFDFTFQTSDRKGNLLLSGGDYELCLALRIAGYKIYYSNKLKFKHYISKQKTTIRYYKNLLMGFGLSGPATFVYSLTKNNFKSYKNNYRYILMRHLKNILISYFKLTINGYLFSRNKYKYLPELYRLYTNRGGFLMTFKVKNKFKKQFVNSKLFILDK